MALTKYSHLLGRIVVRHWFAGISLLVLIGHPGHAQITPQLSVPQKNAAPLVDPPHQLSPQKMEEALRLLLRADSVATQRQRAQLGLESSGLVVDQTITKIGHDFYDQFFSHWEAPADSRDFIIAISEKPSRGNNAIVTVTVNDEELMELPLQAKYEFIEETAQQAIEVAKGFLQQAHSLSQQLEKGNKQPLETY